VASTTRERAAFDEHLPGEASAEDRWKVEFSAVAM
jgi:hypothetical protein